MTTIHLKRYYSYLQEDITLEVPDEIAATLSLGGRTCENYLRKKWYHHEYSLDCDDGIENDTVKRPPTPEEKSMCGRKANGSYTPPSLKSRRYRPAAFSPITYSE